MDTPVNDDRLDREALDDGTADGCYVPLALDHLALSLHEGMSVGTQC